MTTRPPTGAAVLATGVSCRYGARWALRDVSLRVDPGEVVGVLGPNGAGKTTLLDIVCGLVRPTSGQVSVCGFDVRREAAEARRQIGVLPQETALYDELDAMANLRFAARLYSVPKANERIAWALELVGLSDRRDDRVSTYSGGMKRRLAIARALLHDPAVLILDEPTIGVDVEARHAIWQHVRGLRAAGRTVTLTTNYLDEAEALCDRVVILRAGKVVAVDTPAGLVERAGRCIDIDGDAATAHALEARLRTVVGVTHVESRPGGVTVFVDGRRESTERAMAELSTLPGIDRCRARSPALAEVFELLTTTRSAPVASDFPLGEGVP